MSHNIAGIDIHKKLLVVVMVDAAEPDVPLQSRRFGTGAAELSHLLSWLMHYEVREAVMESTAQYWKPVWMELEPHLRLHLAQAQSNRAPRGRKSDLADTKRLIRRFAAGELMLSFIPEPEQRAWRMVTRGRLQLVRARVQLQNQIESLLEAGRIKLSSVISDLLGASGRRILRAISAGESDPEVLAELGDRTLQCGRPALVDALTGSMGAIHCQLLAQHLDRIELIDRQIEQLNQLAAAQMQIYQEAVTRLIEVPGIGAEAAQEILAEIGPQAAAFPSAEQLASWIGVCRALTRVLDRTIRAAPPRAIASCGACCAKQLRPPPEPKEALSRRSLNAWWPASDMSKRSGLSPTGCAESCGTSCIRVLDSSSSARPETRKPFNAPSVITSKLFVGLDTRFPTPLLP